MLCCASASNSASRHCVNFFPDDVCLLHIPYLQCHDCGCSTQGLGYGWCVFGLLHLGVGEEMPVGVSCAVGLGRIIIQHKNIQKPQSFRECFSNLTPAIMNFHSWARGTQIINPASSLLQFVELLVLISGLTEQPLLSIPSVIFYGSAVTWLDRNAWEGLNLHRQFKKSRCLVYFCARVTCLGWYLWYFLIVCDVKTLQLIHRHSTSPPPQLTMTSSPLLRAWPLFPGRVATLRACSMKVLT